MRSEWISLETVPREGSIVRQASVCNFRFPFALAFDRRLVGDRCKQNLKGFLIDPDGKLTEGTFSKDSVQAQTPARRNDLVGMHGTFVAWWTTETMSFARISDGQPRLSIFTLGTMALLMVQILSSCGRRRSLAVARASVANRGAKPCLVTAIPRYPVMLEAALMRSALLGRSIGQKRGMMDTLLWPQSHGQPNHHVH